MIDISENMLIIAKNLGIILEELKDKPFLFAKVKDSAILMREVAVSMQNYQR